MTLFSNKFGFSTAEAELILRGLIAECTITKRWDIALSITEKVAPGLEAGAASNELHQIIINQAAREHPGYCGAGAIQEIRRLIEHGRHSNAERLLILTLNDQNRVDRLTDKAELVTLLSALYLGSGRIGEALDLFAQQLPPDLVACSREIGPAAAAMHAELLCAAGELRAASEAAARLKLLWPRDPIVSRLLGLVLNDTETACGYQHPSGLAPAISG